MKLGQRLRVQETGVEQPAQASGFQAPAREEEPTWKTVGSIAPPPPPPSAAATGPKLVAKEHEAVNEKSIVDPMLALKERLHAQLMDKLGGKLFEGSQSEKDMRATVVDMITQAIASEAVPLSMEERNTIVAEITDDACYLCRKEWQAHPGQGNLLLQRTATTRD
jgi:hypothetical protein